MRIKHPLLSSIPLRVIILALLISASIALSFHAVKNYLESKRQNELQTISSEISTVLEKNFLDIHSRLFYESLQFNLDPQSFDLSARKIIQDYPSVLAIELRNADGKLLQHANRFGMDPTWGKGLRQNLPPWVLSYFDEAVTNTSPKLTPIYSAQLSPIFLGSEYSRQFLAEEFLPLNANRGVIVIIFNPEKWFFTKNIIAQFEKHPQFRFKLETSRQELIASSDNTDALLAGHERLAVPLKLFMDEPLYLIMENRHAGRGQATHFLELLVVVLAVLIVLASIFIFKGWQEYSRALAALRSQEQQLLDQAKFVSLGEISTILAHELNQPLAAIETYSSASTSLLAQTPLDQPRLFKAMVAIRGETERINQIIKNIRNYIVNNQTQIVQLDPSQLVESLQSVMQMQAIRYEAKLVIEQRQGFMIHVDRLMLEQVILNLARNAFEAMLASPLGKRVLTIVIDSEQGLGSMHFIDTGPGISPEVAAKLFTPFFSTKPESMGIALSLCRSLVERYQGQLTWQNNPQGGAQFTMSFKIAPPEHQ
jgi:signal transduction histidine kinase